MKLRSTAKGKDQVSTIYLLRHAHSKANASGILAGQLPGIELSTKGKEQSELLARVLGTLDIKYVHASPLERCLATVNPYLLANSKVSVREEPALIEMNYGDWTGKKLNLLARRSLWKEIQKRPSGVTFPSGESFLEMRHRAIGAIEEVRKTNGNHLVVSHGDVIRVILNHYLGAHIDEFQRLSVDPASISVIRFTNGNVSVQRINSTTDFGAHSGSTLGGGAGSK